MNPTSTHALFLIAILCLAATCLLWFAEEVEQPALARETVGAPLVPAAAPATREESHEPVRARAARGAYELAAGDRFTVDCALAVDGSLQQADALPVAFTSGIAGTVALEVLAVHGDEFALAAAMVAPRVVAGREAHADAVRALEAVLQQGFVVRMGRDGSVRGYRFPAASTAEQRNQLRTLCSTLRATVGAGDQAAWSALEADASGTARVQGAWDAGRTTVQRAKVAYEAQGDGIVPAVEGSGTAVLDAESGWWSNVQWREVTTVRVPDARLVVEAGATASAELVAGSFAQGGAVAGFDWEAPWAPASGAEDREDAPVDPEHERLGRELRGVSLDQVLDQLRTQLAAGGSDVELYELRVRIVWLLENDPAALRALAALVADASATDQLVAEVLSAVGSADSDAAQEFLAGLVAPSVRMETQLSALRALFQVAAAAPQTLAAVGTLLDDANASRELQGTSLLLLGALADVRRGAAADVGGLLAREAQAAERGMLVDWLEAVGNSGNPAGLDAAVRHLASADGRVRSAAVSAVRAMGGARALDALVQTALHDVDARVRAAAVETLAGRPETVRVRAVLEQVRDNDPVAAVRTLAQQALDAVQG